MPTKTRTFSHPLQQRARSVAKAPSKPGVVGTESFLLDFDDPQTKDVRLLVLSLCNKHGHRLDGWLSPVINFGVDDMSGDMVPVAEKREDQTTLPVLTLSTSDGPSPATGRQV